MMEKVYQLFQTTVMGIALWVYFAAFGAIFIGFIGKKIAGFIFKRLIKATEKTTFLLDDLLIIALSKPIEWTILIGGLFVALMILPLPTKPLNIEKFVHALLNGCFVALFIWFAVRLVDGLANFWQFKASQTDSKLDDQLVPIVRRSSKVFLFIIGIVLVLQNMGYSVGSLLAGMGIGGVALAMASKDTVANLFGSLVIFLDKPFQIGDWIEFNNIEGTVEEVGLRTTRIRTFANSLFTVPNALFTTNSINNWSRMKKRRIKMTVGVTYSSSPEKIDELVLKIRKLIETNEKLRSDFYLVNFDQFGASSLEIFIYCFTVTTNWAEFLQAKQEFMLSIMHEVQSLGLDFAFPTRTIHLKGLSEGLE